MRPTRPAIYRHLRLFWPGGLDTRRYLRELERTQWLSRDELHALQLAKIQTLVRHAYENVPFYRERYQAVGFHPEDLKSLTDFQELPCLTKEDIRQNREALAARTVPRRQLTPSETGGSTGQPTHFYVDDAFWRWNAANHFRVRGWHGVEEGDRTAWLWGARQDMPEWSRLKRLKAALMNERYLNAFDMTEENMGAFAERLCRRQPAVIYGYASALSLFARYLKERDLTDIRPHLIDSTSETLFGPQRELLQEVFRCRVVDNYSSRELGVMAFECETGELLVTADVRYLELAAGGQVVPTGQMGEVVITSLYQFSWPFIRYRNGDMAVYAAETSTSGRGFPVLKEIVGRTNDFLVSSEGAFIHSQFFAHAFRARPEVVRYQVHQPDRYRLRIHVVCGQVVSDAWLESVRGEVQARFGPATHVFLQVVDEIPLTPAGKHRHVVSDVKPDWARPVL